jgi:steroid delta-isomerase-like uncharacterized protein
MAESTTSAENRATVRRGLEAFNAGDAEAFGAFFAREFVDRDSFTGQEPGPTDAIASYKMWLAAFPDSEVTIEDMIAEVDKVVVRSTLRATRTGEFEGQPPDGKRVLTRAINIYRLRDGRVVERWRINEPLVEDA